ncbi:hypothetical protein [Wenzhouxiangella marina]|uniref:hypothetical protein n=1 Tax=Wenzhouxiangella marina TaxID=1579979 RepID=UPI0012E1345A|nr:hypothetical protein [Wenzhouxiangella marina]MBB6086994.1 drug/metabolite transporter (DMT)-like permease [Wenzhouxiangella marina]
MRDAADIGAKLSWQGALILGALLFIVFYLAIPAWINSVLEGQKNSMFYPTLEAVFARRTHWVQWVGIACALVGAFFALRNYHYGNSASGDERGLVALLARLLGRSLD